MSELKPSLPNKPGATGLLVISESVRPLDWRELWEYRELALFLAWRDISVRYKQTALGAAWAVIQPVTLMIIFSIFFGRLAKIPSDGLPYPVFSYAGLLTWHYFSGAISACSASLIGNTNLLTKVYFPRLLLPLASLLPPFVDFAIATVLLLLMMMYWHVPPRLTILVLPLFLTLAYLTALGAGLWLCALSVEYRDIRHVVPFLVQIWMFASPVAYPLSIVPPEWQLLYGLNPMAAAIEGARWCFLGTPLPWSMVGVSFIVSGLLVVSGLHYFGLVEKYFADRA